MHEVSPQISTAVSKLPIWRNSREACQQSDTHKLWSEAKQKNCQGEGDKWSQTYLYQPFESESIGSATPKQKGAGAERPHLPVSLRSARHCLLPFPRAAFLLISSSWLSSSMAGHRNPREAAESGRQRSTYGSRAGTRLAQSTRRICRDLNGRRDIALLTPLSSFPSFSSEVATGKQLLLCEVSQPYWAGWNQLLVKSSLGERFIFILGSWMTEKCITRTSHWK